MIAKYRDSSSDLTHVVVYDTQRSLANKVRFAVRNKLAGVSVFSIDTDDFKGQCKADDDMYKDFGKYPGMNLVTPKPPTGKFMLLTAVNEAFEVAYNEFELEKELKVDEDRQVLDNHEIKEDTDDRQQFSGAPTYVLAASVAVFMLAAGALA